MPSHFLALNPQKLRQKLFVPGSLDLPCTHAHFGRGGRLNEQRINRSDRLFEELRNHVESANEDINEVAERFLKEGLEAEKEFPESRAEYMFGSKIHASYPIG